MLPSGGTIKFWSDYPGEESPTWESTFKLNSHDWDLLLKMVLPPHDIEWITNSPPNLGGATEWLDIYAGENKVTIPPDLILDQMEMDPRNLSADPRIGTFHHLVRF